MFGIRSSSKGIGVQEAENRDVAKLFFDSFSKRVGTVEASLREMSAEFDKLKTSVERGQISDLVLLERLQKTENLIRDSISSVKAAVENTSILEAKAIGKAPEKIPVSDSVTVEALSLSEPVIASQVVSPTGEVGSLRSITTVTELQVLTLLMSEGPKSAPEIGKAVGRSREHTARLMKKLYEEGYVRRDQTRIPFRYSAVDRLKQVVKKPETKDEGKEAISVPQT